MALQIAITRSIPLYPFGVFLQWDVKGASESGSYVFEVSRSGGSAGPWEVLGTVTDAFCWNDVFPRDENNDINQLSLARGIYYRVVVTPPSGPAAEVVSIVEPKLDGYHRLLKRKILRDQALSLRKLNGLEVVVLKKMRWGPRCPKCYDPHTESLARSSCTTCFGTSYVRGYFTPVTTLARHSTPVVQSQLAEQGMSDSADIMLTLLDVPLIEQDDILIFTSDNRRFIVKQQIPGKLENVTVFQRLQASELPRSSIEYRLVVDTVRYPPLF